MPRTQAIAPLALLSIILVSFYFGHADAQRIVTWGWEYTRSDATVAGRYDLVVKLSPNETTVRHYTLCTKRKKITQVLVDKTGGVSGRFKLDDNLFITLTHGGPDAYCATVEFMVLPTDVKSLPFRIILMDQP